MQTSRFGCSNTGVVRTYFDFILPTLYLFEPPKWKNKKSVRTLFVNPKQNAITVKADIGKANPRAVPVKKTRISALNKQNKLE